MRVKEYHTNTIMNPIRRYYSNSVLGIIPNHLKTSKRPRPPSNTPDVVRRKRAGGDKSISFGDKTTGLLNEPRVWGLTTGLVIDSKVIKKITPWIKIFI